MFGKIIAMVAVLIVGAFTGGMMYGKRQVTAGTCINILHIPEGAEAVVIIPDPANTTLRPQRRSPPKPEAIDPRLGT